MRWVPHAAISPHRCAVIPFVGNSNTREGFIDSGNDLPGWDPHVYISVTAVKEMAGMIGWGPVVKDDRVERLEAELAEAHAELEELNREFDAIDVLASRGFQARKKPGRKEKAAA